jgi:PAS domain S-box-containing protein
MRSDVRSSFEAVRLGVDAELSKIESLLCSIGTADLKELLAKSEVDASARADVYAKVRQILSTHLRDKKLECLFLLSHSGRVVLPLGVGDSELETTAADREVLAEFASRFLRQRECRAVTDALPRAFVVTASGEAESDAEQNDAVREEEAPRTTLFAVGVRPIWVRPDAPHSLLVGGVTLASLIAGLHETAAAATETDTQWHAFSVAGNEVPIIFAGGRVGTFVRRGLVRDLLAETASESPAFTQVGPQVSRWVAVRSADGGLIGGWGVSVSQDFLASKLTPKFETVSEQISEALAVPRVLDMVVASVLVFAGVVLLWVLLALWAKFVRPKPGVRLSARERREAKKSEGAPKATVDLQEFHRSCREFLERIEKLFDRSLRATGVFPEDLEGPLRKQFTRLSKRIGGFEAEFQRAAKSGHSGSNGRSAGFDAKFKDFEETLGSFIAVIEGRWRSQHGKRADSGVREAASHYQAKLDELEGVVASAQTDGRKIADELSALRQVEKDLRVQLDEANEVEFELRQKLEQTHLRGEQVSLQENAAVRRLQEVESRAKSRDKDLAKESGRVEELEEQIATAEERERVVNEQLAEAESSLQPLREKQDFAREKITELEKELAAREQALAESQDVAADSEARLLRASAGFEQTKELFGEQNAEFERRIQASACELDERSAEETGKLQKKAEGLELELETLEQELNIERTATSGLREERHALEGASADLRERLESERGNVAELESNVEKASESSAAEVAAAVADAVEARERCAKLERQNAAFAAEFDVLRREIENAKLKVDEAERKGEEARSLAESAAVVEADPLSALMGLDDTSIETADDVHARQDFLRLYEEVDELRVEVARERSERGRIDAERIRLQARVEELETAAASPDQPEPAVAEAVVDDGRLRGQLAGLEKEKASVEDQLVSLQREVEILREESEGVQGFQGALITGNLPAALGAVDSSRKVFVWNPAAEELWGLPAASALGESLDSLALEPATLHRRLAEEIHACTKSGRPSSTPILSFNTDDGDELHVRLFCEPVADVHGDNSGVIFSVENVTEATTYAIESELRGQFQDTLAGSIPMALVVTDCEHRVISWNCHAERILDVDEEEALGRGLLELPLRLSRGEFSRAFLSACEERQPSRFVVKTIDDDECMVTVSPFVPEEGTSRGWVLLVEEVVHETA